MTPDAPGIAHPSPVGLHERDWPTQNKSRHPVRPETVQGHQGAVEQVIAAMQERLDTSFSLTAMAQVALLSPFHFNHVFRSVTGIPPRIFMRSLRIEAAKRLLLTTGLRVTDVCYAVGYESVGTFTSRFTEMVGVSPRRFRAITDVPYVAPSPRRVAGTTEHTGTDVRGRVLDPALKGGAVFVGLFRTRTPTGSPVRCQVLAAPGNFRIPSVPDGWYHVLAAAFDPSAEMMDYLLAERTRLRVGAAGPIVVQEGKVRGDTVMAIRPMRPIDPPIVQIFSPPARADE